MYSIGSRCGALCLCVARVGFLGLLAEQNKLPEDHHDILQLEPQAFRRSIGRSSTIVLEERVPFELSPFNSLLFQLLWLIGTLSCFYFASLFSSHKPRQWTCFALQTRTITWWNTVEVSSVFARASDFLQGVGSSRRNLASCMDTLLYQYTYVY